MWNFVFKTKFLFVIVPNPCMSFKKIVIFRDTSSMRMPIVCSESFLPLGHVCALAEATGKQQAEKVDAVLSLFILCQWLIT